MWLKYLVEDYSKDKLVKSDSVAKYKEISKLSYPIIFKYALLILGYYWTFNKWKWSRYYLYWR